MLLLVTIEKVAGMWMDAADRQAKAFLIGEDGPPGVNGDHTGVVVGPLE